MNAKILRFGLLLLLVPLWVVLWLTVPLSVWLLFYFQTAVGLALALLGCGGMVWGGLLMLYLYRPTSGRGRAVGVGSVVLAVLSGFILWQTPTGQPAAASPISHQSSHGERFQRWALANIVPEIEQMNVGFALMPYLDPLFSHEQAQVVHPTTMAIYQEMAADPDFEALGSVMGWAYNELLGRPYDIGHYYLYVPRSATAGEPLPALVYLHGSGGNFKPYVWILSELAEAEGYVIIAPSFGFGNWRNEGGTAAVLAAVAHAQQQVAIDPDHIYLAGLSNGGLGVSLASAAAPEQFRGLIFISPVMETSVVDSAAYLEQWRARPMLVITGATDKRIPISYIHDRLAVLTTAGVDVTSHIYPDEDHFLFFAQREKLIQQLAAWLRQHS